MFKYSTDYFICNNSVILETVGKKISKNKQEHYASSKTTQDKTYVRSLGFRFFSCSSVSSSGPTHILARGSCWLQSTRETASGLPLVSALKYSPCISRTLWLIWKNKVLSFRYFHSGISVADFVILCCPWKQFPCDNIAAWYSTTSSIFQINFRGQTRSQSSQFCLTVHRPLVKIYLLKRKCCAVFQTESWDTVENQYSPTFSLRRRLRGKAQGPQRYELP